ncbi:hypothetical protein JTB14_011976 [Gonioctena quinquepunctata]|nr:hypothetical protein JTB14_011976 [Gonioctena quinquepunctata]
MPIFVPPPSERKLKKKAEEFLKRRWNYPNLVAAIDGEHVRVMCPDGSAFPNADEALYKFRIHTYFESGFVVKVKYSQKPN